MRILLLAFLWTVFGHAMNGKRVVGQELSEFDKDNFTKIEKGVSIAEDEIVAVQHQDTWRYARIQALPNVTKYGILNLRPIQDPPPLAGNNFGGFVIHFRHVRKLAST